MGVKKSNIEFRGPFFANFACFWALLLKIQSVIIPSILGVRGSSLDGRQLSTILFNNIPKQAIKRKIEKP